VQKLHLASKAKFGVIKFSFFSVTCQHSTSGHIWYDTWILSLCHTMGLHSKDWTVTIFNDHDRWPMTILWLQVTASSTHVAITQHWAQLPIQYKCQWLDKQQNPLKWQYKVACNSPKHSPSVTFAMTSFTWQTFFVHFPDFGEFPNISLTILTFPDFLDNCHPALNDP